MGDTADEALCVSKEFKRDPTIDNYLRLREAYPDVDIEIATSGGIEFAFKCSDLIKGIGIGVEGFLGLLDADGAAFSKVCLHLLKDIARAEHAIRSGETHLSRRGRRIPDNAIDWLICTMLDSESWNNTLQLNRDLAFLIKCRLQGGTNYFEQTLEIRTNSSNAAMFGGRLKAMGVMPSFRKIAKLMNVQPSTVKRWFSSEAEFHAACEPYAHWFDNKGKLKPLRGIARAQHPASE